MIHKSDVEENQEIKDVDREDTCKECTKKMTVGGHTAQLCTFTRLKPNSNFA